MSWQILYWNQEVVGNASLSAMQAGRFRDSGVLRLLRCTVERSERVLMRRAIPASIPHVTWIACAIASSRPQWPSLMRPLPGAGRVG